MTSWIKTAVNRAVEVGGNNNLARTVFNYADTVVLHAGNAVAGGARMLHERIAARNLQSFKHTVKRLEEVSVSCRGVERVQLLRRWLVALKEVERLSSFHEIKEISPLEEPSSDESKDSPKVPTLVYYVDAVGDKPKDFREVFLHSQALEGITLSMILEAPSKEEVSLLLEIYGLCLTGEKEEHMAVMNDIQDLANAFIGYHDEVLHLLNFLPSTAILYETKEKREELLQFAQAAIAGLKVNADLARIDAEACNIKERLDKTKAFQLPSSRSCEKSIEETSLETIENLEQVLAEIHLFSNLEALLLKKKSLRYGDSRRIHAEKVDKLKVLSESLSNSTSKAQNRILDHRSHKEEALNFRLAKANEIFQLEKELMAAIVQLERHKEDLEAELKKVNTSLGTARARLHNVREERDQFDNASNDILIHLKTKEEELSRSVISYREEAEVVNSSIKFLENTWRLQTSYTEQTEKQVKNELERYGNYFADLVIHLLNTYKEKLGSPVTRIRELAENLSKMQGKDDATPNVPNMRQDLEEQYLDIETKLLTTFKIVDTMKKQFYIQSEGVFRKDDKKVQELFDAVENRKKEFKSIERPILKIETQAQRFEMPLGGFNIDKILSPSSDQTNGTPYRLQEVITSLSIKTVNMVQGTELSRIESEEIGKSEGEDSPDEIHDWEFDALEK